MDAVLESWKDFDVAIVGATAALAGLVIVAASVNIGDIVKAESLTSRLASGIAGLVLALTVGAVGLIPHMPLTAYGIVTIIAAAGAAVFQVSATIRIYQNHHPENRMRFLKAVLGFLPVILYVVGGVLLIAGEVDGLGWFAFGSILAIICALLVSWIVLVEVLR
jgi:hypothetical protein